MSAPREFMFFVVIGGLAAALNWAARILIDRVTSFEIAIALAYAFAMTTAFLLNRRFVFEPSSLPQHVQYFRFFLVNVAAFAQVLLVSVALARVVFPALRLGWHADELAHAIGLVSPVVVSYWAHRRFSFAQAQPRHGTA